MASLFFLLVYVYSRKSSVEYRSAPKDRSVRLGRKTWVQPCFCSLNQILERLSDVDVIYKQNLYFFSIISALTECVFIFMSSALVPSTRVQKLINRIRSLSSIFALINLIWEVFTNCSFSSFWLCSLYSLKKLLLCHWTYFQNTEEEKGKTEGHPYNGLSCLRMKTVQRRKNRERSKGKKRRKSRKRGNRRQKQLLMNLRGC